VHRLSTVFVLGYHGCAQNVANSLLDGGPFKESRNEDDWLGAGIYFWESNPRRALSWAKARLRFLGKAAAPAAIGAVIDLRNCLDLTTAAGIGVLKPAYDALSSTIVAAGQSLPVNNESQFRRNLDCAVMNTLHRIRDDARLPVIDTIRAAFVLGKQVYPGAGFLDQTHMQICVRNVECIRGVFRIPPSDLR
jgi:hypothetical protein